MFSGNVQADEGESCHGCLVELTLGANEVHVCCGGAPNRFDGFTTGPVASSTLTQSECLLGGWSESFDFGILLFAY